MYIKRTIKYFTVFFLLVLFLPLISQDTSSKFYINNQPQFEKLFNTVNSEIGPQLHNLYSEYFTTIVIPSVEVVLVKDKSRWRELFIKYPFSEWGAGLAIPAENKVYILVENFSLDKIRETLVHEWLHHAIHHKFSAIKIPTWYEEGMVQKLSGKSLSINDLRILSNKILSKNVLTFKQIDSLIYFSGSKVQLGYTQSMIAVQSMERLIGIKHIDGLILKNHPYLNESFYSYFVRISKISPDAFESRYLKYIKNKYKWFFIFNLENILFIFGIVVLFGAYYHLRYRNKKILDSWEKQETEENE